MKLPQNRCQFLLPADADMPRRGTYGRRMEVRAMSPFGPAQRMNGVILERAAIIDSSFAAVMVPMMVGNIFTTKYAQSFKRLNR